jgi:hypothetical protein
MITYRLPTQDVFSVFGTDAHLSDKPPGSRSATYATDILAKLSFCAKLANKVRGVFLFGGDMFHAQNPNASGNTFHLVNRAIDVLQESPYSRVFGIPGNHDLFADRLDSLPQQPLGSLLASGVFHNLADESLILENVDGTLRVQIDGCPYFSNDIDAIEWVKTRPAREEGVRWRVVLMHQYCAPGDAPMMFQHPIIGLDQMTDCDYDLALWGHDHSRLEPVWVGKCMHVRLGSLSRASLAMDEVDRPVNAAVLCFTPEDVLLREVTVPVRPLEVAFSSAHKVVEQVGVLDSVVEYFRSMDATVAMVESEDPREIMRQLSGEETSVFNRASAYCGF